MTEQLNTHVSIVWSQNAQENAMEVVLVDGEVTRSVRPLLLLLLDQLVVITWQQRERLVTGIHTS